MNRIGINEYYMNMAVAASLRSTCMRRRVGAVIVKDNRILSTGYNGAPKGLPNCIDDCKRCYRSEHNIPSGQMLEMCYAVHAEQNAIMNALKTGEDLKGASLYVNTYPCCTCMKLVIQAGIAEVYFVDEYENEFTKQMAADAGINLVKLDGSIYRTPEGTDVKTNNDLDTIDPLVEQIYKYEPGTEEFAKNRDEVFVENGLYERYNEMIYFTDFKQDKELLSVEEIDFANFRVGVANRYDLEYNGDEFKQMVVGALVFDVKDNSLYVLKCKSERLNGKLTMVQGHLAVPESLKDEEEYNMFYVIEHNLFKELSEEVMLDREDVLDVEFRYVISSNDNKISSEHIGMLTVVYIDSSKMEKEVVSGEPDKHEVVNLSLDDLNNEEVLNSMDTWLNKFVMRLKEDMFE